MNSEAREKVPKQRFEIAARFLELFVMSNNIYFLFSFQ
jgi:hypothetical protein